MPPLNMSFENQFYPCECCKPRYCTATVTNGRKWTKKEIEQEIIYYATELSNKKWYEDKSYTKNRLKHWTEKLDRYNEAKESFN